MNPLHPEFDPTGVCAVVPMFNESSVISRVVSELLTTFDRVLCVDDGSTDDTAGLAVEAGAEVVRHPINLGQGAALRTGFEAALRDPTMTHVVTFDADGQHSIVDAVVMVALARDRQLEVVLGSRFATGTCEGSALRRLMLRLATRFTRATTGLDVTDTHNGLRVLSRSAVLALRIEQAGMAHASEILSLVARRGLRYCETPVTITYSEYSRAKGQSNLNAVNILHELATARLRVPS